MMRWQLQAMWPLLVVLVALAAFALYVYSHSDRRYRLKLLLIPALIGALTFSFPWLASRLGYASPHALPQSFEYVAHKLILQDDRKAWLDILVVSRKPLERDARLHRVPWSKALEEALKRAQTLKQQGGDVHMDRERDADAYPQWIPRRVRPQDVRPKDPLPQDGGPQHRGPQPPGPQPREPHPGPAGEDLLRPQGPAI